MSHKLHWCIWYIMTIHCLLRCEYFVTKSSLMYVIHRDNLLSAYVWIFCQKSFTDACDNMPFHWLMYEYKFTSYTGVFAYNFFCSFINILSNRELWCTSYHMSLYCLPNALSHNRCICILIDSSLSALFSSHIDVFIVK